LSFRDTIFENQQALLDVSSLQGHMSCNASQQISGEAKVCSPEVHGCILAIALAPSSQDPELHHLWFTAAKAALTFTSQIISFLFVRISRAFPSVAPLAEPLMPTWKSSTVRSHCTLDPRTRQARNLPRRQFTLADGGPPSPQQGASHSYH